MATYRAPKVILPIFNPLVYRLEEAPSEIQQLLVGYTFTALYQYPQPNPNTDLLAGKWETIASSDDCSVLYIPEGNVYATGNNSDGYVYVSNSGSPPTDGSTFVQRATLLNHIGIACSADGTRAVTSGFNISDGYIYYTSNSGVTWNLYSLLNKEFTNFACSSSGLIMYGATQSDFIYKSTDGGSSWSSLNNGGNRRWGGVTCSADGGIVYGCVGDSFGTGISAEGYIYKSTDGGSSWIQTISFDRIFASISCDSTGQIVIAGYRSGLAGRVIVSIDGGSSWSFPALLNIDFLGVKCSPDGTKLFACSDSALYYSLNLGGTWTNAGITGNFKGATCNTDGTIVYVVDNRNPTTTGGNVWRGVPVYITS